MTKRGFIVLARSVWDHPVVGVSKPLSEFEAWVWLLLEAVYEPRNVKISNGRASAIIELQRGQLSHSIRYMAAAWGWTTKRVRGFLARLERAGQTTTQRDTLQSVLTICNYDDYQISSGGVGTQIDPQTGKQRARKGHKEEESKEMKKVTARSRARADEPEGFSDWYAIYPRPMQRKDAAKAYRRVVPDRMTQSELLEKTREFAAYQKAHTSADRWRYIPYPASWLNKGGYLDGVIDPVPKMGGLMTIEEPTRDPTTFTEREWRNNMAVFEKTGTWSSYWGPRPGAPGCLVPSELLSKLERSGDREITDAISRDCAA